MAEVLCVYRQVQVLKKAAKSEKPGRPVAIVSYDEKPGLPLNEYSMVIGFASLIPCEFTTIFKRTTGDPSASVMLKRWGNCEGVPMKFRTIRIISFVFCVTFTTSVHAAEEVRALWGCWLSGQHDAATENRSAQRACPANARRQENVIVPELTLLCRLHS